MVRNRIIEEWILVAGNGEFDLNDQSCSKEG